MVEVNVEPDGSTTFEDAGDAGGQEEAYTGGDEGAGGEDFAGTEGGEEAFEEVAKSIDPAIYLLVAVVIFLVGFVIYQRKKKEEDEDDFFSNLDGEKVRFEVVLAAISCCLGGCGKSFLIFQALALLNIF